MAYRPCLTCGSKIWGPAFYSYLTWYVEEQRTRFRLVECSSCAADRRNAAAAGGDAWVDDAWLVAEQQLPVEQLVRFDPALGHPEHHIKEGSGASRRTRNGAAWCAFRVASPGLAVGRVFAVIRGRRTRSPVFRRVMPAAAGRFGQCLSGWSRCRQRRRKGAFQGPQGHRGRGAGRVVAAPHACGASVRYSASVWIRCVCT